MYSNLKALLLAAGFLLASLLGISSAEDGKSIDPKAEKVLRQMGDFLSSLNQFTFHSENSVEVVLDTGLKIELGRSVDVFVRRPDRLRADVDGDDSDQQLFYDGKLITLHQREPHNFYATIDAPPTIEEALNHAIKRFNLVAPLADIVYRDLYNIAIEGVTAGYYIGDSKINGIACHHLAFREQNIDWQVWVEKADRPFPRKLVITDNLHKRSPQFTAVITKWQTNVSLPDDYFVFVSPKDARKIEFLPIAGDRENK
jgi:hypothetical protein